MEPKMFLTLRRTPRTLAPEVNFAADLSSLPHLDAMDNDATGTLGPPYQHEPLPDASSYIRLLNTKEYDGDDPYTLECHLTTWPIDESPTFHAISYSWGDPTQTALLRVNGSPLSVTENCEVALCQANVYTTGIRKRRHSGKRDGCYYWCDAVCIDQGNKAEKEAQVASMGRIYRRAEHVLVCLGAPVEGADSPFLFRKLRSRSSQLRRIGEHWLPRNEFKLDIARLTDEKWTRMVKWFLLSMPRCRILRLCRALESLLGTAYFGRTWICQELFLGTSVILCCGIKHAPISAIYGLAQASLFLASAWRIKSVDRMWRLFDPWTSEQQLRNYDCGWTKYFLWLIGAGSSPDPQTRDLGSLMWYVRYQECGDVRDKVYGTLSMVDWPDREPITVDYGLDVFDLALQVMEVIRKRPGCWDGRWYDVADSVALNLGLGAPALERLTERVREHHFHVSIPLNTFMEAQPHQELAFPVESYQHDTFWGYRLVEVGDQWVFENGYPRLPGLAEGRKTRIQSWHVDFRPQINEEMSKDAGLDDVFLPSVAQPGDWCLLHTRGRPINHGDSDLTAMTRYLSIDKVVLVARQRCHDPAGHLSVIGKGLINSDMTFTVFEHPIAAKFKVHLDDEDALFLAATSNTVHGSGSGGPVDHAGTGPRTFGSEASWYFNATVCMGSNSIYAIKMEKEDSDKGINRV